MDTLRDKVAVITGAGSGIGRAIGCALAYRAAHIRRSGGLLPLRADVSNPEAFEAIRNAAVRNRAHRQHAERRAAAFLPG